MIEQVQISDMYVQCALMVRNFTRGGVAMSDCCQLPANSAVRMPSGVRTWRCPFHMGVVDFRSGALGDVSYTVPRRLDDEHQPGVESLEEVGENTRRRYGLD